MFKKAVVVVACIWVLTGGAALADSILITGDGPLGDFAGQVSYTLLTVGSGDLAIELTNTSPASNGGFRTALVRGSTSSSVPSHPAYGSR